MTMYDMTNTQYQLVYNVLSFALASMMATTVFLWMRAPAIVEKYKSAVIVSGLVTFIASYHYMRIFNSWTDSYEYSAGEIKDGVMTARDPKLTGVAFNDAYRYMDWLLTVPLLLLEILMVLNLPDNVFRVKATKLGFMAALMIATGYYGELIVTGNLVPRWVCWGISMFFFSYIMGALDVLMHTVNESDPVIRKKIFATVIITAVSWCTYPVVYLFPMLGSGAASAVVAIQVGYCCSDVISKCVVGLLIYQISSAKSKKGEHST
jgi:bacteriorhodopsin